jgi:hypothetical protein
LRRYSGNCAATWFAFLFCVPDTAGMPRARAILKYIPALLCGLLVVVWVVNLYGTFGVTLPSSTNERLGASFHFSDFTVWKSTNQKNAWFWSPHNEDQHNEATEKWLGQLTWEKSDSEVSIPIALLITVFLPVALGCLFRFPLWSYFAWTALVAAELAYYLR